MNTLKCDLLIKRAAGSAETMLVVELNGQGKFRFERGHQDMAAIVVAPK